MSDRPDIEGLKEVARRATPGEWRWDAGVVPPDGPGRYADIYVDDPEGDIVILASFNEFGGFRSREEGLANAGHIVRFAPEPALRLLAYCEDLEARAQAAEARLAEVLEALKPFAAEADEWVASTPDEAVPGVIEPDRIEPGMAGDAAKFTLGDLRRALSLTNAGGSQAGPQPEGFGPSPSLANEPATPSTGIIRPGDTVECIDSWDTFNNLTSGQLYVVLDARDGMIFVRGNAGHIGGWWPSHFRRARPTEPNPTREVAP